jgi:protease I
LREYVFVICHGGWVLVSAGLVDGRTMTSWPTLMDDIRKPVDIPAFNQKMLDLLHQRSAGQPLGGRGNQQGIGLPG